MVTNRKTTRPSTLNTFKDKPLEKINQILYNSAIIGKIPINTNPNIVPAFSIGVIGLELNLQIFGKKLLPGQFNLFLFSA